jgi:hypothetical protein
MTRIRVSAPLVALAALLLGVAPSAAAAATKIGTVRYARLPACSGTKCDPWELTMRDGRVVRLTGARADRDLPFMMVSADGRHLVYNRRSDRRVVVHDLADGRIHPTPLYDVSESGVHLSADGRRMVITDGGPTVDSLTDLATGKTYDLVHVGKTRTVRRHLYEEFESFSPDGRYLLLSSNLADGTEYTVLDARGREVVRRQVRPEHDGVFATLAGDHTTIALAYTSRGRDGVRLYHLRTGRVTTVPVKLPKDVGIDGLTWARGGGLVFRTGLYGKNGYDPRHVRDYGLDPETGRIRLLRSLKRPAGTSEWVLPDLGD